MRFLLHLFKGFFADEKATSETIAYYFNENNYLCDTHTAVALKCAYEYWKSTDRSKKMLVDSTASPYKFPVACLKALGGTPDADEFAVMRQLREISGVLVPQNLAGLQDAPVLHTDVIEKEEMLDYVLRYLAE